MFRIILAIFMLDQISKFFVTRLLLEGESLVVVAPVFYLTYLKNPGAAFGLLASWRVVFIVITVLLVVAVVIFARYLPIKSRLAIYGLALLLGGAMGNLVDRLRTGYVIDFLDFRIWPVFNLADVAIVMGVGLLCWDLIVTPQERSHD